MQNASVTKQQLIDIIDNPEKGIQKEYKIITEDKEIVDVPISRVRENAILGYEEIDQDILEIFVKNDWSI